MNEKKLRLIASLLIIGIIGLVGYILYEKSVTKEPERILEEKTEENKREIPIKREIRSIKDFPKENDNSVLIYGDMWEIVNQKNEELINIDENFQNKTMWIENTQFEFSCEIYREEQCEQIKISVNNKPIFYYNNTIEYSLGTTFKSMIPYLLLTKEYIILNETTGGIGNDTIFIYDKFGVLEKEIQYVADIYISDLETNETKEMDVQMKLVDNKLYFVTTKDSETAEFNYYDFSTKTINVIEEFSAWTTQQK